MIDQAKVPLVDVLITTKLGAEYQFPDVEKARLEVVCPYLQDGVPTGFSGQLSLVNASIAVLSVPLRIIRQVHTRTSDTDIWEVWWTAPVRSDECYPV
jgi:hypothetical protein